MYTVRATPPKEIQEKLQVFDSITQQLLFNRGIHTKEEADAFFQKDWNDISDPFSYKQMQKVVDRIYEAIAKGECIGIYSDYDCDGIPGAAAMWSTLQAMGHTKMVHYMPNRNEDGFGINKKGIEYMREHNASLVITIDCGTAHTEEIEIIQEFADVIILDHHLPGERVPNAFAMINPVYEWGEMSKEAKQKNICGAGCVFKCIQALFADSKLQQLPHAEKTLQQGWEKWQLDMIGLATIADMVSLRHENRLLAHYGLEVLRKSPRPGVQALCEVARLNQKNITEQDIAFTISPRINAASRMGQAEIAFELLTTNDDTKALALAKQLQSLNEKRKRTVATMMREAHKVAKEKDTSKHIWVFGNRKWQPSLAGLLAQKLAEEYGKMVFVWGQGGGVIKGSCRTKVGSVFEIMQNAEELFVEYGGHIRAGGFTIKPGREIDIEEVLNEKNTSFTHTKESMEVDVECDISHIEKIYEVCKTFAPFGVANERPIIAIPQCTIRKVRSFGQGNTHTSYTFVDDSGSIEGVALFTGPSSAYEEGETARAVIGTVEYDAYRGRPSLRVIDIL